MEQVARFGSWGELYVMLGTSSAALIGLLYVVTSLHLDEIVNDPASRRHARSNSLYLIITVVVAAIILTPQPDVFVGVELAFLNLAGLMIPLRNISIIMADWHGAHRAGFAFHRSLIFITEFVAGGVGGAILALGSSWGLYLVTASYVGLLVSVTINAWSIMVGVGEIEKKKKRPVSRTKKGT
jgi:hypothetical protein